MTELSHGAARGTHEGEETLSARLAALSPERRAIFERLLQGDRVTAPIAAAPGERSVATAPLSYAQERLWFLEQLLPGKALFNLTSTARLNGPVDAEVLERSLNEVVRRHESLRTVFVEIDGEPHQVVAPRLSLVMRTMDHSSLTGDLRKLETARVVSHQNEQPFDLHRGPLLRATLVREDPLDHVLVVTMHHIVSDLWSLDLLWGELSEIWDAFSQGSDHCLPEPRVQYRDFAVWERSTLQGAKLLRLSAYWKRQLHDVKRLNLVTDRPRPPVPSGLGAAFTLTVPVETLAAIKRVARDQGATLFMVLLTGFMALLYRYTGQKDIAVGTFTANRDRVEIEDLIGFFVNTLVLRADFSDTPTLRDALERVRCTAIAAFEHQDLPFPLLIQELAPPRDLSRNQLFDVAFQLGQRRPEGDTSTEIAPEPPEAERRSSPLDITVTTWESPGGLCVEFEYSTDLFDESTIARLGAHYRRMLEAIASDLDQRISRVTLLSPDERALVTEGWNRTAAPYDLSRGLAAMFETRATRTPHATALVTTEGQRITFAELQERVRRLSQRIAERTTRPEAPVGVCLERSVELVVAALAVLHVGGTYLPLDPSLPSERLQYMVTDAGAETVVTCGTTLQSLRAPVVTVMDVNDTEMSDVTLSLPVAPAELDQLASIIYTSGSTGDPKGIAVSHRQILNRLHWMWSTHPFGDDDVGCIKTPIGFIDSLWEIFGPLLQGSPSLIVPESIGRDPVALVDALADAAVTRIWMVPSMLRALLQADIDVGSRLEKLTFWVSTGEPLCGDLLEQFHERLSHATLYNLYGTSEVWDATWHEPSPHRGLGRHVPIGRPIANVETLVLDECLQPVPIMVPGELHIGGAGISRGYLGRPDLTAERFLPHPFTTRNGSRLYATGDLARWLSDGTIELLGRADDQVKIRGCRIELGEIETALRQHPLVDDAAVLLTEDDPETECLVAYVTCPGAAGSGRAEALLQDMRKSLHGMLPQYMIPATMVALEAFPSTASGKVDRIALSLMQRRPTRPPEGYEPPRSTVERELAEIWTKLLGIGPVGRWQNFFDSGGHSLLGVRLMARVNERFHVSLPLRVVFEAPTLASLAEMLEASLHEPLSDEETIERVSRSGRTATILPDGELELKWPVGGDRAG